jgi:4-coumarate--CoA ligase
VVLVSESENKMTEKDIQKWIEPRVAKHKWLKGGVSFVEEIPRLGSGKIMRKTMREWAKRDSKHLESIGGVKSKL